MSDLFNSLVSKRPTGTYSPATSPQVGRVTKIVAAGVVFVLDDWDGGVHEFGPAPWNHAGNVPTPPPVGADCLVIFVGAGIGRPWVVAWAPPGA